MMKKVLSIFVLFIGLFSTAWADDFPAVAPSGQTLYYRIVFPGEVFVTYDQSGYQSLTGSLIIPSTVTNSVGTVYSVIGVDGYAFYNCSELTSVSLPNTVTTIGMSAFYYCTNLSTISFGESITSIGSSAFAWCENLTELALPASVQTIGATAFADCFKLRVYVPNTVLSIGDGAFMDVPNVIYYGSLPGAPWDAWALNGTVEDDFVYSDSTKTNLLRYFGDASHVVIPATVASIDLAAFSFNQSLTSVTLPESLTSIAERAFALCDSLVSITSLATVPPALGVCVFCTDFEYDDDYNVVSGPLPNAVVHVPVGTVPAYRTDTAWGMFNIITDGVVSDTLSHNIIEDTTVIVNDTTIYQLPYSANFSEGWTFTGGASLTADSRIRLDSTGQKAIGPWLQVGLEGQVTWQYTIDPETGSTNPVHFILSRTNYNGHTPVPEQNGYVMGQSINGRYNYGTSDNGKIFRFELEYTEENNTTPIYLSAVDYIQTICDMEIFGPDTVYVGQMAHYTSTTGIIHHAIGTEPDSEPSSPSFFWKSNVNEYDFNYIESRNRDSIDVYWNEPGLHQLYLEKVYYNYYNGLHVGHTSNVKNIVVIEEPVPEPTFCDTMVYQLPYFADFTQCWYAANGAEIIDDDTVRLSHYQRNITSPLIQADSDTYIHFTFDTSNLYKTEINRCARIWIRIYSDGSDTPILSETRYQNVSDNVNFKVPSAGNFRVVLTHSNGDWSNTDFRITRFWADSYPWSVEMQVPERAYRYNRTTFIAMANLPDTTEEISFSWRIGLTPFGYGDTLLHTFTTENGLFTLVLKARSKYHGDKELSVYPFPITSRPCTGNPISQFPYTQDFEYGMDCWQLTGGWYNGTLMTEGDAHGENNFYQLFYPGTLISPTLQLDSNRYMMTFYAHQWGSAKVEVICGMPNDTLTMSLPLPTNWKKYEIILPELTTWVGFRTIDEEDAAVYIDDITIASLNIAIDSSVMVVDTIWQDTILYSVIDSVVYNITTIDSVQWNIIQSDSVVYYYDTLCAVHDTTYIDFYVHDTTFVPVHDTNYINIHDTTYITLTDTVTNTVCDTVTNTVFDTVTNTIYDTTLVYNTDTLWLHDTVFVHDTIFIYDTIYVGVDDVETISAKIYTSNGQIVVDGAEGNTVWLYDINGRILATKQDEYLPLRFDVSASGTYLVKIGNHPARKVVVIR